MANYAKHKINFELASVVFDDPLAKYILNHVADGEERWHVVGTVFNRHVLLVVHTYRNSEDREVIRIISARHASPHERRQYEER